ncbi:MAG: hypothetical protein ACXAE3_04600 [Candidatus Kariarchaeaceae archaeon]|jgi:hypothetical protein
MRFKLSLFAMTLMLLLLASSPAAAQVQSVEMEYTTGLSVGDKLVYTAEIDENYTPDPDFDLEMDYEDGDTLEAIVTESIDGTVNGEYEEFFGGSISFDSPGEFTTTLPNGTEIVESSELYVMPTAVELENGTDFSVADGMLYASGASFLGQASEQDGIVTISIAFGIIWRLKYDANTGILQEMIFEDAEGDESRLVLGGGGLLGGVAGLPAYDVPVVLGLSVMAIAFTLRRRR